MIFLSPVSTAETLSARDIVDRTINIAAINDSQKEATMVIQRGKQKLTRKLIIKLKKYGQDQRSLTRFFEPAEVRDTQFLSWTYEAPQQDDDLWVFLPSEGLVRRISGGGKKGSFMRSDFANEDIENRAVDDDTHILLGESEMHNRPVYIIESTPKPSKVQDSNYAKRKLWIDKERWVALQVQYYDRSERLLKQLSQGWLEQIDGIWTATKLIMETPRRKSRTLMQYSNIRYNTGQADSEFENSSLKR